MGTQPFDFTQGHEPVEWQMMSGGSGGNKDLDIPLKLPLKEGSTTNKDIPDRILHKDV
ncbi:MAG: hypothetical protein R6X07_13610 [Desulfatiglandales bacterium]